MGPCRFVALLLAISTSSMGCAEQAFGADSAGGSSAGGTSASGGTQGITGGSWASSGGSAAKGSVDSGTDSGSNTAVDAALDAAPEAVVDHSDLLPAGVTPPALWFWRGIDQGNLGNWHTDASGRHCADGDTTMWFRSPGNSACMGAPACDPDHFGTPEAPCTGVDCSWRNWDDPRGPEFRVSNNTGPVEIHNWGAKSVNGGKLADYGFEVTVCAAPGTVADIDTCPRTDLYSCVEENYPQFVDACTTVLINVNPPAGTEGCYSSKSNVTITF